VIAFIFADLIPILTIYRKYYGLEMAGFLFTTFYISMAGAALIVEVIYVALGLIPAEHNARVVEASITWNYTTWLNIVFLALLRVACLALPEDGGPEMLRMMNGSVRLSGRRAQARWHPRGGKSVKLGQFTMPFDFAMMKSL
jgi:hypothetical protein